MNHIAYIALGTNLGEKEENILKAYSLMEKKTGRIVARSSMFHSPPWGFDSHNEFINTACKLETTLSPHRLLEALQQIEQEMGRTEKSQDGCYHDRIIDLDILLYDHLAMADNSLTIPHPLMSERDFVMRPLREVLDETVYPEFFDDDATRIPRGYQ